MDKISKQPLNTQILKIQSKITSVKIKTKKKSSKFKRDFIPVGSDIMAPRRSRKTTALIKIVRSTNAGSMLRPRKVPPFFKIAIVVICGYVIWNLNHPSDETLHQNQRRDFQSSLKTSIVPQQNIPGMVKPPMGMGASPPASPGLAASVPGQGSMGVGVNVQQAAVGEKQQQILESLKRIRWRQKMMQQLQLELFRTNDPSKIAAATAAAGSTPGASIPQQVITASNNLANAQAAMLSSQGAFPSNTINMQRPSAASSQFSMPGSSTGMPLRSVPNAQAPSGGAGLGLSGGGAAVPAAKPSEDKQKAVPDVMNMSLEELMALKPVKGGVAVPPAPEPAARVDATKIFGQLGEKVPFRTPAPETSFDATFGKLPSTHFPDCQAIGKAHNVAFLKTHKTGSSTMSNIMLRYADRHNLTVGLPLEGKWELGGYPAYIDKRLIDPDLPTYNILGHHFRYNRDKLDEFMDKNTKYITIIRSPVDNVESVFGFFQDQEPFMHWMEEIETTQRLGTFYADPHRFFNKDTDWYMRSKNYMFFDIGYDVSIDNDELIDAKIQEMQQNFAFVLLTDYFDESLILMKNLLCWDWDDVVYVKFKMRTDEAKATINPTLAEQITSWNRADFKLYDHFNTTFWELVGHFGQTRMDAELEEFRARQKAAEHECIQAYEPFKKKPWILGAKLKPRPSEKCRQLAWSETVYGEHLREKMYKNIYGLDKPTIDIKASLATLFSEVSEGAFRSV